MEIKKIMNENKVEEMFDVREEGCADDCPNWVWIWYLGWVNFPTSKTTYLW